MSFITESEPLDSTSKSCLGIITNCENGLFVKRMMNLHNDFFS